MNAFSIKKFRIWNFTLAFEQKSIKNAYVVDSSSIFLSFHVNLENIFRNASEIAKSSQLSFRNVSLSQC